jgi:hypothetical protein
VRRVEVEPRVPLLSHGQLGNVGGGALLTPRHQRPLRPASALLLTVASPALLLAIIGGPADGWLSPRSPAASY